MIVFAKRVSCTGQLKVYMDASSIAKRPTELIWIFCPEVQKGAYAPPIVQCLVDMI